MSTQKPQPKSKAQPQEHRDDLELDAETVKDLEPKDHAEQVRGGGNTRSCSGGTNMT